ncbi:hypothetical protein VTH82DRAFT_5374 [Thermothelomyces myriococcoides]
MAPVTRPSGMDDIPIMKQQGLILFIIVSCCIFMFFLVMGADRWISPPPSPPSPPPSPLPEMAHFTFPGGGGGRYSYSSPGAKSEGKRVIRPSETTPLLSPKSTIAGFGASASFSPKRSDSTNSWSSTDTTAITNEFPKQSSSPLAYQDF